MQARVTILWTFLAKIRKRGPCSYVWSSSRRLRETSSSDTRICLYSGSQTGEAGEERQWKYLERDRLSFFSLDHCGAFFFLTPNSCSYSSGLPHQLSFLLHLESKGSTCRSHMPGIMGWLRACTHSRPLGTFCVTSCFMRTLSCLRRTTW